MSKALRYFFMCYLALCTYIPPVYLHHILHIMWIRYMWILVAAWENSRACVNGSGIVSLHIVKMHYPWFCLAKFSTFIFCANVPRYFPSFCHLISSFSWKCMRQQNGKKYSRDIRRSSSRWCDPRPFFIASIIRIGSPLLTARQVRIRRPLRRRSWICIVSGIRIISLSGVKRVHIQRHMLRINSGVKATTG